MFIFYRNMRRLAYYLAYFLPDFIIYHSKKASPEQLVRREAFYYFGLTCQ